VHGQALTLRTQSPRASPRPSPPLSPPVHRHLVPACPTLEISALTRQCPQQPPLQVRRCPVMPDDLIKTAWATGSVCSAHEALPSPPPGSEARTTGAAGRKDERTSVASRHIGVGGDASARCLLVLSSPISQRELSHLHLLDQRPPPSPPASRSSSATDTHASKALQSLRSWHGR
jgi:hypothetical protein